MVYLLDLAAFQPRRLRRDRPLPKLGHKSTIHLEPATTPLTCLQQRGYPHSAYFSPSTLTFLFLQIVALPAYGIPGVAAGSRVARGALAHSLEAVQLDLTGVLLLPRSPTRGAAAATAIYVRNQVCVMSANTITGYKSTVSIINGSCRRKWREQSKKAKNSRGKTKPALTCSRNTLPPGQRRPRR